MPPIYVQAGSAEILIDMIRAFADRAQGQGADVTSEVWEHLNHDFQAYAEALPQEQAALQRLCHIVHDYL